MGIDVTWDTAYPNLMLVAYPSHWTWEEIYAAERTANAMVEEKGYTFVVTIHDMSQMERLPVFAVSNIKQLVQDIHPATHLTVFVGMSPHVKIMWDIAKGIFSRGASRARFDFASNMDEAREKVITHLTSHEQTG